MNRYLAEFIGTFALVFMGCGAAIVNELNGSLGGVGVSLVFGFVVMVMIYAVGNVSGAHFNPAVTIGFLFAGRLKKKEVIPYITAQLLGAITASAVHYFTFIESKNLGVTLPTGGVGPSIILEFIFTFLLMFVILNVSTGHKEKGIMAGVAVGGTVAMEALMGGSISGASMNPARSIAPAIFSGKFGSLWLYIIFPILGAIAAHPFCKIIQGDDCCEHEC